MTARLVSRAARPRGRAVATRPYLESSAIASGRLLEAQASAPAKPPVGDAAQKAHAATRAMRSRPAGRAPRIAAAAVPRGPIGAACPPDRRRSSCIAARETALSSTPAPRLAASSAREPTNAAGRRDEIVLPCRAAAASRAVVLAGREKHLVGRDPLVLPSSCATHAPSRHASARTPRPRRICAPRSDAARSKASSSTRRDRLKGGGKRATARSATRGPARSRFTTAHAHGAERPRRSTPRSSEDRAAASAAE